MHIRGFAMSDYDEVYSLWNGMPGIGLSDADERGAIEKYLHRNPGMSFVAVDAGRIVGAVLCGHDGRRGYLHHMVVAPSCRQKGTGRALAQAALDALFREGITKCHLFVKKGNALAGSFWSAVGWQRRDDLLIFSANVTN